MPEDWSQLEVEAIVADYFVMWEKDLCGEKYNKAEHNRLLQKVLPKRSRGSIEKKHQNISAVLWHLGYPYIDGYKPLPRYQILLRVTVEQRLERDIVINRLVAKKVQSRVNSIPLVQNLKAIQVSPPSRREMRTLIADEHRKTRPFVRRNYLELEANNKSLGDAGEDFILRCEYERLWRAGKRGLANKIEHVAKTKGDYLGFDILSYEVDGRERFIEVKTTRFGALTRFFVSANEVDVSLANKEKFQLYRLFHFEEQPKFFILAGPIEHTCRLKAFSFAAVPI